jgi:hypothetical protein
MDDEKAKWKGKSKKFNNNKKKIVYSSKKSNLG